MDNDYPEYEIDLYAVLVKPLYLGMLINLFIPLAIVGIAYYIEQQGSFGTPLQAESFDILFWVLLAVALLDGVMAIFLKQKMFFAPMIKSRSSFEEDFKAGVFRASLICYGLTSAISIYGLVVYLAAGTFQQLLLFVFISFIAFQLIRPRIGFLKKVLAAQREHSERVRNIGNQN